jgi:uncharacterized phiE125 gp8 family phage protein
VSYGLVLASGPVEEPVSVEEAKSWCRIDHGHEDDLLAHLVRAAREYAENFTGRALATQTWELWLDAFPSCDGGGLVLPRPPLQSVASVVYADAEGVSQTLATDLYSYDAKREPGWLVPAYGEDWPDTNDQMNAVKVTFVAGYGRAAQVPALAKLALRLLVCHWYVHRDATGQPLEAADSLLWQVWPGTYV